MATSEVVFITGANTGIGYEAVKALFQSPKEYRVFLGSRSLSNATEAIDRLRAEVTDSKSTVEAVQIDVTDDESIGKAFELIKSKVERVDVLVNNAGASLDRDFNDDAPSLRSMFNATFNVNITGSHIVTYTFAPLLMAAPSPRLIFLTSGMSTLTGNSRTFLPAWTPIPGSGWPKTNPVLGQAYRSSKAGLNMLMLTWHWILKEDGVKTWCISPGFLATNLGGNQAALKKAGAGDPARGGDIIRRVVEGERDGDVGKVVTQNGVIQDW